jgi:hypothetical protein
MSSMENATKSSNEDADKPIENEQKADIKISALENDKSTLSATINLPVQPLPLEIEGIYENVLM